MGRGGGKGPGSESLGDASKGSPCQRPASPFLFLLIFSTGQIRVPDSWGEAYQKMGLQQVTAQILPFPPGQAKAFNWEGLGGKGGPLLVLE